MSSTVKRKAAVLLAPLACLCLSAHSTDKDRIILIGPMLEGEDLEVQFSFYKQKYGLDYWAYFDAFGYGLPTPSEGFTQIKLRDLPINGDGFATFEATIPGKYFQAGIPISIELGLCQTKYYRGIDWSNKRFSCNESFSIQKGQKVFRADKDGLFETQNNIYHADEEKPTELGIDHDSYSIKGLLHGSNLANRMIPITQIHLTYFGFGAKPKKNCKAELRLLDHIGDFEGIAKKVGSYATIPLIASIADRGGGDYEYSFSLAEAYYYSRIDLKAYRDKVPPDEPTFQANALFLPLREGHDDVMYHFQIALENAGAFSDQIIMDNFVMSSRSFFGNCLASEYCVVGGGR